VVDLVIRERYNASDPGSASDALRSVIGEGSITATSAALVWNQMSLVDDGISVTRITSSGSDVRMRTPGSPDLVAILVREGGLRMRRGDEETRFDAGSIGLMPMGEAVELLWDEVGMDLFSLPLSSIARLLGAEGRAVTVHAPTVVAQDPMLAEYWRRLATGLTLQMLTEPDLYQRDLLRAQLVDALAAVTIEAFGLSDASEEDTTEDAAVVSRAVQYMSAHLGEPISVTQIATATRISVRGLQLLFQRELASTPIAHLRRLRMAGARVALEAPARGTTVGAVGRRFGYSNLGRFSAHYRDEFDEAPSRTLQRAQESASR
jgi:AraC-like DNA-binding protein